MQGRHLLFPVHIPGTLTANLSVVFQAPCDLQLVSVQAVGSNVNDATLQVGVSGDSQAYLSAQPVGDAGAPRIWGRQDFSAGQYPRLPAGTTLTMTVDCDGEGGTAVQNLTVVLMFVEG